MLFLSLILAICDIKVFWFLLKLCIDNVKLSIYRILWYDVQVDIIVLKIALMKYNFFQIVFIHDDLTLFYNRIYVE